MDGRTCRHVSVLLTNERHFPSYGRACHLLRPCCKVRESLGGGRRFCLFCVFLVGFWYEAVLSRWSGLFSPIPPSDRMVSFAITIIILGPSKIDRL